MGSDGMHPTVLRELADVVALMLSIIFEKSRRMGEVPDDSRKANVIPVFKNSKEIWETTSQPASPQFLER